VLDCANGAASAVAPAAFRAAGADVVVVAAEPDGTNINAGCGSTHPAGLQDAVVVAGADAGLAFDGDADRVVAVAGDGALVDGDRILAICAADLHRRGRLRGDAVVLTVMSNLGLRQALAGLDIATVETPVGDRYVLEAMEQGGLVLGGEQSGHIIFRDLATTGDGVLTGLVLLDAVARSGQPLGALAAAAMTRLPQVLRNVAAPADAAAAPAVAAAVASAEAELGETGRVLLRPSGTEPLVRVMVEAPTEGQAAAVADRLSAAVRQAMGRSGGPVP
jgi:phosphoglucosamine mutase